MIELFNHKGATSWNQRTWSLVQHQILRQGQRLSRLVAGSRNGSPKGVVVLGKKNSRPTESTKPPRSLIRQVEARDWRRGRGEGAKAVAPTSSIRGGAHPSAPTGSGRYRAEPRDRRPAGVVSTRIPVLASSRLLPPTLRAQLSSLPKAAFLLSFWIPVFHKHPPSFPSKSLLPAPPACPRCRDDSHLPPAPPQTRTQIKTKTKKNKKQKKTH